MSKITMLEKAFDNYNKKRVNPVHPREVKYECEHCSREQSFTSLKETPVNIKVAYCPICETEVNFFLQEEKHEPNQRYPTDCPFCGSIRTRIVDTALKYERDVYWRVKCDTCGAYGPAVSKNMYKRDDAIILWNNRV
jgi:Lar family restriction alleviation protein